MAKTEEVDIRLEESEVTEDLGYGKVIVQDKRLYRFTSDSILLSEFASAKSKERVADLCSGSGIVGFHYYLLHTETAMTVTLFEMQESLNALARKTIALNGFTAFEAITTRLQDIGKEYTEKFSLVLCNPPYETGGFEKESYEKAVCRKELTVTLKEIAECVGRLLKFGGRVCMVHRADRIAEICYLFKERNLEVKRIKFVSGKEGDRPYLVLIEAVKGGKPNVIVETGFVNGKAET